MSFSWLLAYPRTWYETYRLKARRKRLGWTDAQYYEAMFSLPRLVPEIEGDKFAAYRDVISAELAPPAAAGRVLDLATGAGYQARNAWEHGRRQLFACDVVPDRVNRARERSGACAIRFFVCAMENLALRPASLQSIVISAALHDICTAHLRGVLAECHRALAAGGRLIVMEPRARRDFPNPLIRLIYGPIADLLDESVNMLGFIEVDLVGLARSLGFTLLRQRVLWYGILSLYTFERTS